MNLYFSLCYTGYLCTNAIFVGQKTEPFNQGIKSDDHKPKRCLKIISDLMAHFFGVAEYPPT